MTTRAEIFTYVKEKYNIEPDYPWRKTPNYAILRHKNTRKWFVAVIDITADKLGLENRELVDVVNVKCKPHLIPDLCEKSGIFPGWHENKKHWISVLLGKEAIAQEMIFDLIDISYQLTK